MLRVRARFTPDTWAPNTVGGVDRVTSRDREGAVQRPLPYGRGSFLARLDRAAPLLERAGATL